MAMLLVLMLIVLVSAAGVFAAQAAAMDIRSSGYMRQAGQSHYVAETGVVMSADELRRNCSAYYRLMRTRAATATTPTGYAEAPVQQNFYLEDFVNRTATGGVLALSGALGGPQTAGSLGASRLVGEFVTTAVVLGANAQPTVGFDASGGRQYHPEMLSVEFDSSGSTRLYNVTDTQNNAVGVEAARVIMTVPCL